SLQCQLRSARRRRLYQVVPAPCQFAPRADLDHWDSRQSVGRAATGRKHVNGHTSRELEHATDAIAESSTLGYLGSSSARIRCTACSTTSETHCTVVVMARMFRVPTDPSGFR